MKTIKKGIVLTICLALLCAAAMGLSTSLRASNPSADSVLLACIEAPHNDRH